MLSSDGSIPILLLTAGATLVVFEAFVPGAQFIVVGIALLAAGVVGVILPGTGALTLLLVFLVAGIVTFYVYREVDLYGESSGKTSDGSELLYERGTVTQEVTPSSGKVNLDKPAGFTSTFSARSEMEERISEGTRVMVTDFDGGNVLTVSVLPGEEAVSSEKN